MRAEIPPPFAGLTSRARRRALLALAALALALVLALSALDARLRTPASPHGIVSFELAGDRAAAARMLEAWGDDGRRAAAHSLRLDFLFLAAYAPGLALLCGAAAERARRRGSRLAAPAALVAWAQLAAGGLDALENLALLRVLGDAAASGAWPALAAACAWPKFALVAAGFVQLGATALGALRARRAA
jgi:hypothetical protein